MYTYNDYNQHQKLTNNNENINSYISGEINNNIDYNNNNITPNNYFIQDNENNNIIKSNVNIGNSNNDYFTNNRKNMDNFEKLNNFSQKNNNYNDMITHTNYLNNNNNLKLENNNYINNENYENNIESNEIISPQFETAFFFNAKGENGKKLTKNESVSRVFYDEKNGGFENFEDLLNFACLDEHNVTFYIRVYNGFVRFSFKHNLTENQVSVLNQSGGNLSDLLLQLTKKINEIEISALQLYEKKGQTSSDYLEIVKDDDFGKNFTIGFSEPKYFQNLFNSILPDQPALINVYQLLAQNNMFQDAEAVLRNIIHYNENDKSDKINSLLYFYRDLSDILEKHNIALSTKDAENNKKIKDLEEQNRNANASLQKAVDKDNLPGTEAIKDIVRGNRSSFCFCDYMSEAGVDNVAREIYNQYSFISKKNEKENENGLN